MLHRGLNGRTGRTMLLALTTSAVMAIGNEARATEGCCQNGFGVRGKALAGAGVADGKDAAAIALNPAGLANVDDQTSMSISLFSPQREYEAGPNGPITPGEHGSENHIFVIPNFAWTHSLSANTVLGVGMIANGGMNTRYPVSVFPPYGRSPTGVDLNQMFLTVALAHRIGNLSVGVSPIAAFQLFEAEGLGTFGGFSNDPQHLTDEGNAFSYGGGVRGGVQYDITDKVRVGASMTTRMWMTDYEKYKGLFAGEGDLDIPAHGTVGLAVDVTPAITLMFDYKHVFFSDVDALGRSSAMPGMPGSPNGPLGSDTGPGFGWHDMDVFKFGAEWRYDDRWTLRAGYSYNTNPVQSADVAMNILAPAVVQHHITTGFKYKWSDSLDLQMAAVYVPESTLKGTDPFGYNQSIEIRMHQYEIAAGFTWHWDGARKELEPLK